MRETIIERNTAETQIKLKLNLDGGTESAIATGCGFLDHMLTLFARHGHFSLCADCKGDTNVDYHHTTEDIGICLGEAFAKALGDMRGIKRYAHIILPMDEALILAAVDVSGRSYLAYDAAIPTEKVGDFDTELAEEFFLGFTRAARITLHIRQMAGSNSHHIIEGMFKAFGRVMAEACAIDEQYKNEIPSTKGMLV
ncbi:MAG: imidazoleglycerol-phosphate dehydratase HisB [Clostridia bacterium]|nr:imidazoleglycerol-phosphate dehydratase HisB [Clostridia bacterium]MBQ7923663.1 imidazoleglycerol-phosphate dehydratase HisB [Clostridia bacterium]